MNTFTAHDIPRLANVAYKSFQCAKVLVWWDLDAGEFLVMRASAIAATIVLDRLDCDPFPCLVGIYDHNATEEAIAEALRDHCSAPKAESLWAVAA